MDELKRGDRIIYLSRRGIYRVGEYRDFLSHPEYTGCIGVGDYGNDTTYAVDPKNVYPYSEFAELLFL